MWLLRKYEIVLGFLLATAIWAIVSVLAQETSNPNEKTKQVEVRKPDEIIAEYTELLAWFTGVLAVVSTIQGIFLYRADKTARLTATAAKEAANAATINANLLLATERPYLFITAMSGRTLILPSDFRADPSKWIMGYRELLRAIDTKCMVRNYGKNPALMRQISARLGFSQDQSQIKPLPATEIPPVIAGGDTYSFDVPLGTEITEETAETAETALMIQAGQLELLALLLFHLSGYFR